MSNFPVIRYIAFAERKVKQNRERSSNSKRNRFEKEGGKPSWLCQGFSLKMLEVSKDLGV